MLSFGVVAPPEPEPVEEALLPQRAVLRRFVAVLHGLRNSLKAFVRLLGRKKERREVATILVTGASVGIGLELAKLLISSPHRLVLTARAGSLLRFAESGIVPGERVLILPLDVTIAEER